MRNSKIFILLFSLFLVFFSSCWNNESKKERTEEEELVQQDQDLLSTIEGVTELSRFAMELGAAEIADLEKDQRSYTFFAPRNGAFIPYYDEADNRIIDISSKDLISYHITSREFTIDQIEEQLEDANDSLSLRTLQGEEVWITREDGRIILRGKYGGKAQIEETMESSNGIVHIIDQVLIPAEIEEQSQHGEN